MSKTGETPNGTAPIEVSGRKSLRARLILLLAAIFTIPLLELGYFAWRDFSFHYRHAVGSVVKEAESLTQSDLSWIDSTSETLATFAASPPVTGNDPAVCSALARQMVRQSPRYVSIGAVDAVGRQFCHSQNGGPPPTDFSDRAWFQRAKNSKAFSNGGFIIGRNSHLPMLIFSYPIYRGGNLAAVVYAGIDPLWLSHAIARHLPQGNAVVLMFQETGPLLARHPLPDSQEILGAPVPDSRLLKTAWEGGGQVVATADPNGPPMTFAVRPFRGEGGRDLFLAVGIPNEAPLTAAMERFTTPLVGLLLMLAVVVTAVWIGTDRLVHRPMNLIMGALRRMGAGETSWRIRPNYPRGEFGTIARAVDHMADEIENHIRNQLETEKHLAQAEKMDAIGNLAGGIVHDLKNMLFPILTLTQMTLKTLPEGSHDRVRLEKVMEAAERARTLTEKIHGFSHADDESVAPHDPAVLIRNGLELLEPLVPSSIRIETDVPEGIGMVRVDAARFQTALLNLGSNAAHAMEGRTGRVSISASIVRAEPGIPMACPVPNPGHYCRIEVSDTGCGMDAKTAAKVFKPYFTTKERGKGTGLGLPMVQKFVIDHRGGLCLDSRPQEGTAVTLYLPVTQA